MTDTSANTTFVIPVAVAEDLYRDTTVRALREICAPVEAAKPGDVIGIYMDVKLHRNGISTSPVTQLARINDDAPSYQPRRTGFMNLPEDQQARAALACMKLQCAGLDHSVLERQADRLDPKSGDDVFFDLLLMPDMAILSIDNYGDEVFDGRYCGEDLEQDQICEAFRLLVPEAVPSNHALLPLRGRLEPYRDLVNTLYPVYDDEGDPVSLALPDLTDLVSSGVASRP